MGSQSRQPEKNRSHVIDAPPDDDNDDVESGLFLPVKEAHSGGENSTTASLDQNTSPAEFRRHFNYVYFHQITLVFAIAIPLLIVAIVLITVHLGDIKGYAAPRLVRDTMGSALLGVVNNQPCPITFLINNHHANEPRLEVARHDHLGHRRRRTLLSLGLGTAIHGMSAFAALSGVDGALSANDFVCLLAYQEPGDEPVRRCMQFAAWFNIVLFFYLTLLCIFGLLHILLFVASFTATYRSMAFRRGSESGFRLPAGPLSFEFTLRVLRQDSTLPGPTQPTSRVVSEQGGRLE